MKYAGIAAVLGLAADAEEKLIVAEAQKLKALQEGERTARERAEAKLFAAEVADQERRRTGLIARGREQGKLLPESKLEAKVREVAERSLEAAEALVEELPRIVPLGVPPVSLATAPTVGPGGPASTAPQFTDAERQVLDQLNAQGAGLSVEDFLRAKSAPVAQMPADARPRSL